MSEKIIKRSGNVSDRKNANKVLETVGGLQGEYKSSRESVRTAQENLEQETQRLRQSEKSLIAKKEKLGEIQEEIDSDYLPEGAQPVGRIQARDRLRLEISQLEAVINAQNNVVREMRETLRGAEKKMFLADKKLSSYVDNVENAQVALKLQAEMDTERASRLAAAEKSRALRIEKENAEAIEARASQVRELELLAQSQVAVARDSHRNAANLLNKANEKTNIMVKQLADFEQEQWNDRTEAILELRTNQQHIRSKAATESSKYQQKVKAKQDQLEREKEEMISKGLNPYEEFRKKELSEEKKKQEKKIKDSINQNKAILAERLIREEDVRRKADVAERREKAYEKKHREELGAHVIEERNREYLRQKTSAHTEILDPTGRAHRIDPSKITDIPDASFGLGLGKSSRIPPASMSRIVDKIRSQLKVDREDYGEYQRLVERSHSAHESTHPHSLGAPSSSFSSVDDMNVLDQEKLNQFSKLVATNQKLPGVDGLTSSINIPDEGDLHQLLSIVKDDQQLSSVNTTQSNQISGSLNGTLKKYPEIKKSKFEEKAFEKAKERQQKAIEEGTQQIAGGKVFKGQAFISSPSEIIFQDFEVNKTYKKKFLLTNTSYTFNTFKLLPLSDSVIDFFEINYDKPGRMSAGVSCTLNIQFIPKLNQDINSSIEFFSETGPFSIPLKCFVKRCQPEVINPLIDFGNVIIGQQLTIPLRFKNTGALGTKFQIVPLSQSPSQQNEDSVESHKDVSPRDSTTPRVQMTSREIRDKESQFDAAKNEIELDSRVQRRIYEPIQLRLQSTPLPISLERDTGYLEGYSEGIVNILCSPLQVGKITQQFQIIFLDVDERMKSVDSTGRYIARENVIETQCICDELPIYLQDNIIDIYCTVFQRIYRKKFTLFNRSSLTYSVNIKIPPPFNQYIEINPSTVYLQGNLSQSLNLKFEPNRNVLSDCKYFSVLYTDFLDAGLLKIPIEMKVVNQELPIFCILQAKVCTSAIELSQTTLPFDDIYISQQKTLQLTAKNNSLLPQKIAFIQLKKEISVQPNDGFAVLLPNEETQFNISLRPMSALQYSFPLTLATSFNDQYLIKVTGNGVEPPVLFDSPVLHLRPTIPGERVLESTIIRNVTKIKQAIEIVVPDIGFSWLKVSPNIITLPPNSSARIEIEYNPPATILEVDNPLDWHQQQLELRKTQQTPFENWYEEDGWAFGSGKFGEIQWKQRNQKSPSEESEEIRPGVGDDEWGIVGKFFLPVFLKPPSMGAITKDNISEITTMLPPPLYFCLETVVAKPEFVADTNSVDFGQIAVGIRTIRTIKLKNTSLSRIMSIHTYGLNPVGPFTIINANRTIEPGQWHTLVIECQPVLQGLLIEVLELSCSDGGPRITLTLRVQGVNPSIEITGLEPASPGWSPLGGIVNFGNAIATDEKVKKFTLHNKSLFSIEAIIERAVCAGLPPNKHAELIQRTASGLPIFSCRPEVVVIPEGGSTEVEIIFRPDRPRLFPFREDFNILVGKGDNPIRVCAVGRSRPRQMTVRTVNPLDEPFLNETIQDEMDEDILLSHSSDKVRQMARQVCTALGVGSPPAPVIKLSFPDPYIDSSSDEKDDGVSLKTQTKQLAVCCLEFSDPRQGSGAGSYEFKLSEEALKSKYFTLQNDKGNVAVGNEMVLTVNCILPRPRGLGGLEVGSWQIFHAQLILKGGWKPVGEENDVIIPILLSAYVRL